MNLGRNIFSAIVLVSHSICAQKSVVVAEDTWMAENLKVVKFSNGDPLYKVTSNEVFDEVSQKKIPAYFDADIKGNYYNIWAILDLREIAPKGWHIPYNEEWERLIENLGGQGIAGKSMKSQTGWAPHQYCFPVVCDNCSNWSDSYRNKMPCHRCKDTREIGQKCYDYGGNGTNKSGFSALPGRIFVLWETRDQQKNCTSFWSRSIIKSIEEEKVYTKSENYYATSDYYEKKCCNVNLTSGSDEAKINLDGVNSPLILNSYFPIRCIKNSKEFDIALIEQRQKALEKERSASEFKRNSTCLIDLNKSNPDFHKQIFSEHLAFTKRYFECLSQKVILVLARRLSDPTPVTKIDAEGFYFRSLDGFDFQYEGQFQWRIDTFYQRVSGRKNQDQISDIIDKEKKWEKMFTYFSTHSEDVKNQTVQSRIHMGTTYNDECIKLSDTKGYYELRDLYYDNHGVPNANYYASFGDGYLRINFGFVEVKNRNQKLKVLSGKLPVQFQDTASTKDMPEGVFYAKYFVLQFINGDTKFLLHKSLKAISEEEVIAADKSNRRTY